MFMSLFYCILSFKVVSYINFILQLSKGREIRNYGHDLRTTIIASVSQFYVNYEAMYELSTRILYDKMFRTIKYIIKQL